MIPFVGAGLLLLFTHLAALVFGRVLASIGVSDLAIYWTGMAIDWFFILSYGYYIKRNWDVLSASPILSNEELLIRDSQAQ
jgi:hypothetical protein